MPPHLTIRRAAVQDLPAAARLLAASLRFRDEDAIPAWFMRTSDDCGGITLVAVSGSQLVGTSYAIAAYAGRAPSLFSCGLAVDPAHRGRRIGVQLKLAQREEAIRLGYRRIRWTTDPVNGPALRVYLSRLGARVVGYRAGLHDGLRASPGHPQDDLDIDWQLNGAPALDPTDVHAVELPWAAEARLEERRRVRVQMSELLADGYVGAAVDLEPDRRRCRVTFARERA
jgi:predicted GNAT superfamily acetyltransferase